MSRQIYTVYLKCLLSLVLLLAIALPALGQSSSTASVTGIVQDSSDARIPNASVKLVNVQTGTESDSKTNTGGDFVLPGVMPGHYTLQIERDGFETTQLTGIILNVGDAKELVIRMKVGSAEQTVSVDASGLTLNTTDASVGTVIDRTFVENMPLNGRSFQDLISMTPGAITQSSQAGGFVQLQGDFSINGQRTESNYYMVDGISANTGAGYPVGSAQAATTGSITASTALGTTQNLISIDALQEFKISSSSYSAEYGRTPGGQISFSSRSGTKAFHGSLFDYLRNDLFDANDWFNNFYNVKKPALRQNDFGGTAGGPIVIPRLYNGQSKSFFFASYEGLRLVQPTNAATQYVPSLAVRQTAPSILQPVFNAFPIPTGAEITNSSVGLTGLAPFIQAYSLPSNIDTTSARFDQKLSDKGLLFFRFSYSPSSTSTRTLSSVTEQEQNNQAYTMGLNYSPTNHVGNELRLGFASSHAVSQQTLDTFGGAVPINFQTAFNVPGSYSSYQFYPFIYVGSVGSSYVEQYDAGNALRQWNLTDTVSLSIGSKHQLKLGIDQRHLTSPLNPPEISVEPYYASRSSMLTNSASYLFLYKFETARPTFNEFSAFVQDEWRLFRRLTLSDGIRWEINPPPGAADGRMPYTVFGDVSNPSSLTLAPRGTSLWNTSWYNFAPRLGVAWTANNDPDWETVVRLGGGVFFDTGNQEAASGFSGLGFSANTRNTNVSLPLPPSLFNFSTAVSAPYTSSAVYAYPRHLQLPYALQWNVSVEQALGKAQALTLSYVGSDGRRLLQTQYRNVTSLNPNFGNVVYFPTGVTSNYQALQAKFQRTVATGIQALVSYTWSHALDYGSTNGSYPLSYGNADFDVRHNLQAGVNWDIPHTNRGSFTNMLVNGWGVDGRINARTAFPITLLGNEIVTDPTAGRYYTGVNYNSSEPIYLHGPQYPGGRALNGGPNAPLSTAAFSLPTGNVEGNAPRNFVRAFGAFQVNGTVRRDFRLHDNIAILFRTEVFNIFNHPNFGYVDPTLTDAQFGQVTKMLDSSLGSMSSLYQQGGSRSLQFSLKLAF